jgi:hypothetical protein
VRQSMEARIQTLQDGSALTFRLLFVRIQLGCCFTTNRIRTHCVPVLHWQGRLDTPRRGSSPLHDRPGVRISSLGVSFVCLRVYSP